jgi:Transmembrane domain of unknown function (DUF3566)
MTDPRYPAADPDETSRISGEALSDLRAADPRDTGDTPAAPNGRSPESRPGAAAPRSGAPDPAGRSGWSAAGAGSPGAGPAAAAGPPSDSTRAINGQQNGYAARGYSGGAAAAGAAAGAGAARPGAGRPGDASSFGLNSGSYGASGSGSGYGGATAAGYPSGATPAAPPRTGAPGYGTGGAGTYGSGAGYGGGADATTAYSGATGYGATGYGTPPRGDVDSPSSVGIPMGASTTGTGPFVGGSTLNRGAAGGPRPARPGTPRPARRARLTLRQIDPWSTFKFSLVLAVAMFFVWLVAVGVLYGVLDGIGVFGRVNDLYGELAGNEDGKALITPGLVLGLAALVGAVNIVLTTALATVGAFVYNICADLVGGIEVTLAERD